MLIARVWRGETRQEQADAYLAFLHQTGLEAYSRTPGYRGVLVEQRIDDGRAVFILTTLWNSYEDIRAFAGENYELARYFPGDDDFLLTKEKFVTHYQVVFHDIALASSVQTPL